MNKFAVIAVCVALTSCKNEAAPETSPVMGIPITEKQPLFTPPPPPAHDVLSPKGLELIVNGEVGSIAQYNRHPYAEWPGGPSGITEGVGYDLGYNSPANIRSDWSALGVTNANRLAAMSPYTGLTAKSHLHEVTDILVKWSIAQDVFIRIDVARAFAQAKRTFPGIEKLRPNAQAAILSLGFNRGWSTVGPRRVQMRTIRDAIPSKNYEIMAQAELDMIPLWRGQDIYNGMKNRRTAEHDLLLTP